MTNTFIVKQPFALDLSYYEPIWYEHTDYSLVEPKPKNVIARATYGVRKDTEFISHWDFWRSKNIPVGAYHYWYGTPMYSSQTASEGIGDQAKNFIDQITLAGYTGKERLWLDLEEKGNTTVPNGKTYQNLVKQWLDHVERETGQKAGLYSRIDQIYRMAIKDVLPDWINEYPIWLAWYPFGPYIDKNSWLPKQYKGNLNPNMWQYCEDGFIDGFIMKDNHQPTTYDFNVMTESYFESLETGTYNPPVEEPPVVVIPPVIGETMKGTVKVGQIANVKNVTGGSTPVKVMHSNDTVYGTDSPTDIINFTHFYGADGTKVELGAGIVGKVSKTNLIVTNEEEPNVTPPPVVPPTGTSHIVEVFVDGVSVYRTELD